MIRVAITAAYDAICSTLPEGAPLWPVQPQGGQCLIHVEDGRLGRLRPAARLLSDATDGRAPFPARTTTARSKTVVDGRFGVGR
jgi:hypothetical protein